MKPPKDFGRAAEEYHEREAKRAKRTKIMLMVLGTVAVIAFGVFAFSSGLINLSASASKSKKEKKEDITEDVASQDVKIMQTWEMPADLKEVSGLSYIDATRVACVQDEKGTIFTYNIEQGKVEKELVFGPAGDYEGLAVVGNTIWVLRADGTLFEVNDLNSSKPSVQEHTTHLTVAQNCEGLCYDEANNRLLVTIKDKDPGSDIYKGIYVFDLAKKTMAKEPAYKIDLQHELFASNTSGGKKKAKKGTVMPSGIAIHPIKKDIFITDGPRSRLLVMDQSGSIKSLVQLDKKSFEQPEGITFSKEGELFISNEGTKQPGNILKVEVGLP